MCKKKKKSVKIMLGEGFLWRNAVGDLCVPSVLEEKGSENVKGGEGCREFPEKGK